MVEDAAARDLLQVHHRIEGRTGPVGVGVHQSRNEWACTPHAYDYRHPNYPCAKCGFWPGDAIHQVQAL